ncbi:Cthe_2314 family HEPN domain-containing protein [Halomonas cupida]|uniref:Cthe_2314 family HEPN domain-containing protein n=1 Tax=Halomonas cupida TaxID=44933 RepID=UPI0039B3F6CE
MTCSTYYDLNKHPFAEEVLQLGMTIAKEIKVVNGFKVEAEFKREPIEEEFYVLQLSYCLSHLLTTIQQLEHTVLYMSSFSPTKPMRDAGITRATHLLWSVENFVIRTQTAYDRLLILTDRLFHIHNQASRISHESIVTNTHIKRTSVPEKLKAAKKTVKKYYYDRNIIIHESSYSDDHMRHIEGLTILASGNLRDFDEQGLIKEDLKYLVRKYVTSKKREFSRINGNLCTAISETFDEMHPIYRRKYSELCKK